MLGRFVVSLSPLLIAASLVGCESGATPARPAPVPTPSAKPAPGPLDAGAGAVVVAGKPEAYTRLCAICHGPEAKGYAADHAPSLVSSTFLESATDDFLFRSIALGRPGTSMAAYSKSVNGPLDDAAIREMVAWLRVQGPAAKPLVAVAKGDSKRGAEVYKTHCLSCHGDTAKRGEGISLANPQFLQLATDSFMHHAIVHGRPGTKMEAFAGKLSAAQIADVIAYIRTDLARTAPAAGQLPAPTGTEPIVINPKGKQPSFTLRSDPCPPTAPKCEPNKRYVASEQVAKALIAKQKMIIVDARPASDWMRAHIPGAVSIPHHDPKRLDEIKNDGTFVIAYCACPHHLSGDIVDILRKRGIKNSVILDEGILEWHRRGYPITAAEGVTPPPKQVEPAGDHSGHNHP